MYGTVHALVGARGCPDVCVGPRPRLTVRPMGMCCVATSCGTVAVHTAEQAAPQNGTGSQRDAGAEKARRDGRQAATPHRTASFWMPAAADLVQTEDSVKSQDQHNQRHQQEHPGNDQHPRPPHHHQPRPPAPIFAGHRHPPTWYALPRTAPASVHM
jgi:hypothetical protein